MLYVLNFYMAKKFPSLHSTNAKFSFSFYSLYFIIITYIHFNYESIINILKYKVFISVIN